MTDAVDELIAEAVLLDFAGRLDESAAILRHGRERLTSDHGDDVAVLRNVEGMLAAVHGRYDAALTAFEEALSMTADGTALRTRILANLAATSLWAGHLAKAAEWSDAADGSRPPDAAADLLIASTRGRIARARGDVVGLRQATLAMGEASQRRIADLGTDHPQALVVVANLASAEVDLARAEGSSGRLERAVQVLEVASRRLAAELGADHSQALAALANLASAETDLAIAEGSAQRLERAAGMLRMVSGHVRAVLGAEHPHSLVVSANLASSELELAREDNSANKLRVAVDALKFEAQRMAAGLGQDHPEALTLWVNLASAELELARAQGSAEDLRRAVGRLATTADRAAAVFGVEHPVVLLAGRGIRMGRSLLRGGRQETVTTGGTALLVAALVENDWKIGEEYISFERAGRWLTSQEAAKPRRATTDRDRATHLFERLAALPEDNPERLRIRGELVELHLPLVEYLARRFRNRGEWLDDLTQVATIGLIKAIDRFDPARGIEFSTYATPTIVGEIKRHFRDKGWAVRVPRRLQELKLALAKAIGDLAQREGRAPTVAEIAAHLQMPEEEVLEGLESANAYSTVSLDAPDSGDDAPAVAESLGMLDEALGGVEYRESLKPLLEQLPSREKRILLLRFFGNMTQSQIASELGISQMHVSRLLARTLAQLREGLPPEG